MLPKILFLDLEETVIDEFEKTGLATLMHIDAVRAFIAAEAPTQVRLFSFAMSSEHCIRRFELFFEARLSRALGIEFDLADTFTTGKLHKRCNEHFQFFEDDLECMNFHGKDYGFQHFIEMSPQFKDCEVVLVDDSVIAKTIVIPHRNLTIRMVNVNDLPQ